MTDTHGIVFTGMERTRTISRPAGAARLRTFLDQHGYNIEVVDYFGNFTEEELEAMSLSELNNILKLADFASDVFY